MTAVCPVFISTHFPELCRSVDHYCERTGPALDSEPVNAISNVAFLIASVAALRLYSHHTPPQCRSLIQILIVLIAVVGLGSFLFHTVGTRWAEWADVLPILFFILLYVWLILTLFYRWPNWQKLIAVSLLFLATFFLESRAPASFLWGGALYLPTVLTIVILSFTLFRENPSAGKALVIAGAVFLLSFAARTLDMPLCENWPLGTHFLWHLLNAAVLYLLVRMTIVYGPT